MLLGHGTLLQADPWRGEHRGGLCERQDGHGADLRGGVDRDDRLRRDGPRDLRSGGDHPRPAHPTLLPNHRPDEPQSAGQRPRHTLSHGHLLHRRSGRRDHPPRHRRSGREAGQARGRGGGEAPELLPRRGVSSGLPRQAPDRILPHLAGPLRDGTQGQPRAALQPQGRRHAPPHTHRRAVRRDAKQRHRTPLHERLLQRVPPRHLCGHHHGRTALRLDRQVRIGLRLASLLEAHRQEPHHGACRPFARHGAHRGA